MTEKTAYWNDGTAPDADHPREGWYVVVVEEGENAIFGPFTTEAHACHFKSYVENQDHDH